MVARFVSRWQRKRFFALLGSHLALFAFVMLTVLLICEQDLSALLHTGVLRDDTVLPPGYTLERIASMPPNVSLLWLRQPEHTAELPNEIEKLLLSLYPEAGRLFSWPAREQTFWGMVGHLRYTYTFAQPDSALLLHKELGATATLLLSVWLVAFVLDIFSWLLSFSSETRQIRRILQPLTGRQERSQPPRETAAVAPEGRLAASNDVSSIAAVVGTAPTEAPIAPIGEKKLGDLAEVIEHVHVGRLDTRIDVTSCPRELRPLAGAINSMLERIDEAYRLQAQFVSDASHELRTPIAVVQGYAGLLDRWGKDDPQALQESIDAIKSEAEHMKLLVEQLLFLARGESSKLQLQPVELDAAALLEEVCREMQMIDSGHLWELHGAGPLPLHADPVLLKQALRVLADNAMKYSPTGESILLRVKQENGVIKLTVQDNGIGIATEDLPRIFDRFFRADASRDKKTGGAGLGLAIARWIVEKHRGYFELLSRPGIGTRVTICLPREPDFHEQAQK